ncbi:DEAD/DEAH box helicase family protein [Alicyclobacillus tolerans]|uniref:DEAD/DEAH box helicase n=1 Tax=Alicyclobacillus tolerans TaxID=90970 RepID=UPI001F3F1DB9|nr:DEAD/DEAH box helicase [Alicyclobacillus tolerans]MCF8568028.1 DEAD/DEAH box helicase family protein [Alicyclobacillus tolerans]
MKVLEFHNETNWLQASVHFIITREEPEKDYETLIGAGLIDVDSGVRGVAARALKGEWLRLLPHQHTLKSEKQIKCDKYNYRQVNKSLGKVTHTLLLHKSAVDENLSPGQARVLLLPEGGDLAELFARRFASDFNLPYVEDWNRILWDTCRRLEWVESLNVWTDPNVEMWRDIQAFQMSSALDEERAKQIVSELLATGEIGLPEGITDAPPLSEALGSVESEDGEEESPQVLHYLQTYASHLATAIEEMEAPAHDLDRPIDPAIASMARTPFPAQAHTAQAVINGLREQNGVIVSSDMGTGKSIVSLAVANALAAHSKDGFTVLLLVPGITVPKWQRDEIGKTLPNAKVTVLKNWRDVVRYRNQRMSGTKREPLEFLLLSRDTAKLGMPKAPALIYKPRHILADRTDQEAPRKPVIRDDDQGLTIHVGEADSAKSVRLLHDVWVCPECNGVQVKTDHESVKQARENASDEFELLCELKLGFDDLAERETEYNTFRIERQPTKRKQFHFRANVQDYHCSSCGVNLMRYVDPTRESVKGLGNRRLQPAWFMQRYLKNAIDLLIVDELHQYRTQSGQGMALGAMVGAAKRLVALTGTLSDGRASSLYYLLWRLAPGEMLADGIDHRSRSKFTHLYGSMEQRGRYTKDEVRSAGGHTGRQLVMNPPREVPGLSPKLFANYLSHRAVFLELGDLGLPLVELEERPIFVDMEPEHGAAYAMFHNQLEEKMKRAYMLGNKHAFARFIPSVVQAANQPHLFQEVPIGDEGVLFFPPNSETEWSAKEQKLLESLQEDIAQNRRSVIYVRYSGDPKQDQRLYNILIENGIHARILKSSVSPENRVQWLEKAVKDEVQVVISNATLVEVGLDLLHYPSLYFYEFTDQVLTMRQAARRAWRVGQYRRCTVKYFVNNRSYEMVQFKRMMAKRSHSLLLEGRLERGDLAAFVEKDDQSASTFSIASCLGNVEDLSAKWTQLADKDIPAGVMMLEESRFKVEIAEAMKRLAAETRRLASVPEPITLDVAKPNVVPVPAMSATNQLGLFDLVVAEPGESTLVESEQPKPITVGEMRAKMGMVVKAKKAKKGNPIGDDQTLLFAL